jgi:hypothetical protein
MALDGSQRAFDFNFGFRRLQVGSFSNDLAQQRLYGKTGETDRIAAETAVNEHVLNESVQTRGRADGFAEQILFQGAEFVLGFLEHYLGKALDGAQRGAHIVREAVRDAFQLGNGFLQMPSALRHHRLQ